MKRWIKNIIDPIDGDVLGTIFFVFISLLLTGSIALLVLFSKVNVGECFVVADKPGGYYQVIDITEYSYLMQGYGSYIRTNKKLPIVESKERRFQRVDCFDTPGVLENYKRAIAIIENNLKEKDL